MKSEDFELCRGAYTTSRVHLPEMFCGPRTMTFLLPVGVQGCSGAAQPRLRKFSRAATGPVSIVGRSQKLAGWKRSGSPLSRPRRIDCTQRWHSTWTEMPRNDEYSHLISETVNRINLPHRWYSSAPLYLLTQLSLFSFIIDTGPTIGVVMPTVS